MSEPFDDEIEGLAGEYVLGTLPAGERRRVELALRRSEHEERALRAAVASWEARLLPLTAMAEPAEPSPQLWARVEASLASMRMREPSPVITGWWQRLGLWRSLAATGFAAAAALAVVVGLQQPGEPAPRYTVVLAAPGNMAPGWVLQMNAKGSLTLVPLGTTVVPPNRALQLWTKADGWKGPVSLGLVEPGKRVEVQLANLPPPVPNQLFEITLEPEAGSPIGRPTGPILYIGRAVRL